MSDPETIRAEVLAPFKRWSSETGYFGPVVLDSETTDLNGEVIELAIVGLDGRVLFDERIRPVGKVSPGAQAVHGITDAALAGRQRISAHWPRIRRILSQHPVLVYNRNFDFNALYRSLDAAMPDWYKAEVGASDPYSADHLLHQMAWRHAECVMEAYAPVAGHWNARYGSYRWARLTDACEQRGVDLGDLQAHSALGDAQATVRLIHATAQLTPDQLPHVVGREETNHE